MKLKILLVAVAGVAGLYVLNRALNERPRYIEQAPAVDTPKGGTVRATFTVGFLPVT